VTTPWEPDGDGLGRPDEDGGPVSAPATITCVDCGGRCHLLSYTERDEHGAELPFHAGDVVAYRCEDCLDRWDIVLE
jgi:hypothetical protein